MGTGSTMDANRRIGQLSTRLEAALDAGDEALTALAGARPSDWRDLVLTLLTIHDVHTAPLDALGGRQRWQHHPALAALKWRLEADFLAQIERWDVATDWQLPTEAGPGLRAVGVVGLVPEVYRWLAEDASSADAVAFLALEGGPDGGFDDLVAAAQIGLDGTAKLELAQNYWDEMGNGELDRVHTELHRKLSRALGLAAVSRADQPVESLQRSALNGVLVTNRRLQPELVGALGLLELQAGPRCRKVVQALHRLGAGPDALDFYEEHATVDPKHGKDWVDKAVVPLGADPAWAEGMVRGARWRSIVNARFFEALRSRFAEPARLAS